MNSIFTAISALTGNVVLETPIVARTNTEATYGTFPGGLPADRFYQSVTTK